MGELLKLLGAMVAIMVTFVAVLAALALALTYVDNAAGASLDDHMRASGLELGPVAQTPWTDDLGATFPDAGAVASIDGMSGERRVSFKPRYSDPYRSRFNAYVHAHEFAHHLEADDQWPTHGPSDRFAHAFVDAVAHDVARGWWATYGHSGGRWPRKLILAVDAEAVQAVRRWSELATNGPWWRPIAAEWRLIALQAPREQQVQLVEQALRRNP